MNHQRILPIGIILTLLVSAPSLLITNHHIYAQNNSSSNKNNIDIKTMIPKFLQSLRKDISGHYSNPTFGINDIAFPGGWHGRAIETEFGLLINMHPGNESQYLRNLLNRENPVISPVILVQSLNNSVINKLSFPTFSISKNCKELAANSTSVVNGKTFHVYTIECPFSKLFSGASINNQSGASSSLGNNSAITTPPKNFNINGIGQTKVYEYKTPDRTYRLMLVVSSPLFSSATPSTTQKPDISKYIPAIDATAKTLKIK
ncbi:MAG: hypothetical protein WBP64_17850 [Nitrososphaeraceae archaeon]